MLSRAMIVLGAGSSTRFGRDKLLTEASGAPVISHTIAAVVDAVDVCVVVCRSEILDQIASLHPGVVVAPGGATRTASEIAGLAALDGEPDLIGIHDGARPIVTTTLVHRLFEMAATHGGAVPVLAPSRIILDRVSRRPIVGLGLAQTPQVFRGPELLAGYARADEVGFVGYDTADVVQRFTALDIAAVAGEPANVKVTYPEDLDEVMKALTGPSHT